jgi:glucan 1,3-beta-glucosidase
LAERYREKPAVWGIELLNEPLARFWQPVLRKFYQESYDAICAVGRPCLVVVYSDAFTPRLLSGALHAKRDYPVMMDHHWYHFFIPRWLQARMSLKLYGAYLHQKSLLLERLSREQPIIVGEWSGVLDSEKLQQHSTTAHSEIIQEHIQQQLEAFRHVAGWFYWSYKTEDGGIYSFRSQAEKGVVKIAKGE